MGKGYDARKVIEEEDNGIFKFVKVKDPNDVMRYEFGSVETDHDRIVKLPDRPISAGFVVFDHWNGKAIIRVQKGGSMTLGMGPNATDQEGVEEALG